MSSSDTSEDLDSYLHRLNDEEESAFYARRRPALADPLEKGVVLPWNGPNLHPSTLPPSNYPRNTPPDSTPNPARSLLSSLLSPSSPSRNGAGWSLRLVEPLQHGVDNWSQIWRCEVVPPQLSHNPPTTVVLKLRQESLFPVPEGWTSSEKRRYWDWWSSEELVRCEAMAYTRLQDYQGRDIPLCYGGYSFALPCGERVVGVVLEDVTEGTISLGDFLAREVNGERLAEQRAVSLATQAFRHQHRLQNCRVLNTWLDISSILLLRSTFTGSATPLFIAVGFGSTTPLEKVLRSHERRMKRLEATGEEDHDPTWTWQRAEQLGLELEFDRLLEAIGGFQRDQCGKLPFFVALQ